MEISNSKDYFEVLDDLVKNSKIIIDRKRGSVHPRYPDMIYKVDYGYIEGTGSKDGNEIDVYKGSLPKQEVTGILCTFDLVKKDSEIKVLLGLSDDEIDLVCKTHSTPGYMSCVLIKR